MGSSMPVPADNPPAIIQTVKQPQTNAQPQPAPVQPQPQGQTAIYHVGTNDTDPNMTVKSAQRMIEASRAMGVSPVFLLPNQTASGLKNKYYKGDDGERLANNSRALQKYLEDNGVKYVMPEYNNKRDPYHMDPNWTKTFAKSYSNPFIVGDSNAVGLSQIGYGKKSSDGKVIADPNSNAKLSWGAQTSKTIADELEKHLKWKSSRTEGKKAGGEVREHFFEGGNTEGSPGHDASGGFGSGIGEGPSTSDFGGGGDSGGGSDNVSAPEAVEEEKPVEEKPVEEKPPLLNFNFVKPDMSYLPVGSGATFTPAVPAVIPSSYTVPPIQPLNKGGSVRRGYANEGAVSPMGDVYVSDREEPQPAPDDDYNYVLSRLNGANRPEEKPESRGMTLPSPSAIDTIRPSDPQGPKDYTDKWSAQLADKLGMSNEGTRKLQEAAALPAELLGFSPAYRAGAAGARGDYGEAALEGSMAALGMLPFVGAGEKAAVGAAKDVLAAPRAVARDVAAPSDMSRRSFLQGATAAGTAAMLPEIKSATPMVKEIAAPVAKAAPEAIAGAIDRALATPLEFEHPLLKGKVDQDYFDRYTEGKAKMNDFFGGTEDGALHSGSSRPLDNAIHSYRLTDLTGENAPKLTFEEKMKLMAEEKNNLRQNASNEIRSLVEKELGHSISDEEFKPILEQRAKHNIGIENLKNDSMNVRHPEHRGEGYDDVVDRFHGMVENYLQSGEPIPLRSVKKHLNDVATPEFILKNMYGIEESEIPKFIEQYPRLINTLTTDIKHSALYGDYSFSANDLKDLVATPAPTKASERAKQLDKALKVTKNAINAVEEVKASKEASKLEAPKETSKIEVTNSTPQLDKALNVAKNVLATPRAVAKDVAGPSDMSRRSLLQGATAAGAAALLPKSAAPVVKEIAAPIAKAAPEAISGAIDRALGTSINFEHPLLKGKVDQERFDYFTRGTDPTINDFFADVKHGTLYQGSSRPLDNAIDFHQLMKLTGENAPNLTYEEKVRLMAEEKNSLRQNAISEVRAQVEKQLGHSISDEEFKPIFEQRAKHNLGLKDLANDHDTSLYGEFYDEEFENAVDKFHGMIEDYLKSGEKIPLRSIKKHLNEVITPEFILKNMYGIDESAIPEVMKEYGQLMGLMSHDIKQAALYGNQSYDANTLRELVTNPAPTKASEKAAKKAAPRIEAPTSSPQLDAALNVAKNVIEAVGKTKTPKKTPKLEAPIDVPQLEAPVEPDVTKKSGGIVDKAMSLLRKK
jgi:hypothetical protein